MSEIDTGPYERVAEEALQKARQAGADAADVVVAGGESVEVSVRDGALEHLERSDGLSMGLRVFCGKRQAVVSLGDPLHADLAEAAERAVAMARVAPEDPHAALAPEEMLARDLPDLDIDDGFAVSENRLEELALSCEAAALAVDGVSKSSGAGASASRRVVVLAASNGFLGSYSRTSYGVYASVIAGTGADMQRDWDYDSRCHFQDLENPQQIGRQAGERAVRRLHPRKPDSLSGAPVIFEARVAASLAGHLAAAVNGQNIARGGSFLKDRMGARILAEGVSVIDDSFMKRGLASKPFDGEGLKPERLAVVDDGVLAHWLLDLATARQLSMKSNGHASRSVGGPPSPASTNFYIAAGRETPDALIKNVRQGLLVTELIGMGVNIVTGDYSRGASGFWIENGEITHPVSEATIAGNLAEMFLHLTPANDLQFRDARNAPTCLVEGMTIAGR